MSRILVIPDLRKTTEARREVFEQIVLDGILAPVGMPSFKDSLDTQQVTLIKEYIKSREQAMEAKQ
ncbi:cytochrome c [Thiopseudomonas alkaliphila]|uniref:c-type cytochrome n=1 Tax=Thiopseudomonas alkaliphila TaxID=1697053 RepID=UPI0035717694